MASVIGFDLDGTLFDHEGAARVAIERYLAARGWILPGDAGQVWLDLEGVHFAAYAAGSIGFIEQRRRRMTGLLASFGADPADFDVDDLFAEYLEHYRASWLPFPDVVPALEQCRSMGLRLAVLTNGQRDQQVAKLDRMGILDCFEVVLAADELHAFKPSPQAFAALVSAVGESAESVMYVGDDLVADMEGARVAGLMPVWIDRRGSGEESPEVTVISTMAELPGVASR